MKNKFLLFSILICTILNGQNYVDPDRLVSNFAKSENKEKYYGNLVKNAYRIIDAGYKGNAKDWINAFNDVQSIFLRSEKIKSGLKTILENEIDKDIKLQRKALELAYTLFPNSFYKEIEELLHQTKDKISFAISANYFRNRRNSKFFIDLIDKKFNQSSKNDPLELLIKDLTASTKDLPPLTDLLKHDFQKGKTIVYSFFRKNRQYPGITIIKKPDGKFVKNNKGNIFHIPQLSLSLSNLPFYVPNGNTPQGIYSIVGTYISPTETIGPTPNLLLRSPYEVSTEIFYHSKVKNKNWDTENYTDLLPAKWKDYQPIYNSFYTGKIGRKLIIVHGSTDETEYFKDEIYYPMVPTRGCLSSKEIWDSETGKLLESDQVKLINAFRSTGSSKGFLVVVEIDDQNRPVSINEIQSILEKIE